MCLSYTKKQFDWLFFSDYIRLREATIIIQTNYRAFRHRIQFLRKRKAAILLQVNSVFVSIWCKYGIKTFMLNCCRRFFKITHGNGLLWIEVCRNSFGEWIPLIEFSPFFLNGGHFCDCMIAFPYIKPFWKSSLWGANSFIVEETDSYIVVKVFLMDMPFLRVHQFSLMCGRDRFSHTTIINLVVASMVEWVESTDYLS